MSRKEARSVIAPDMYFSAVHLQVSQVWTAEINALSWLLHCLERIFGSLAFLLLYWTRFLKDLPKFRQIFGNFCLNNNVKRLKMVSN